MGNNREILTKAIERAIAGGWQGDYRLHFDVLNEDETGIAFSGSYGRCLNAINKGYAGPNRHISVQADTFSKDILYDHNFAKALWGECTTWLRSRHGTINHLPTNGYQYHLQQMVIAQDPIAYLGQNI